VVTTLEVATSGILEVAIAPGTLEVVVTTSGTLVVVMTSGTLDVVVTIGTLDVVVVVVVVVVTTADDKDEGGISSTREWTYLAAAILLGRGKVGVPSPFPGRIPLVNMTFEIGMGGVGVRVRGRVGVTLGVGFVEPLGVKRAIPPTTTAARTRTGTRIKRVMETILATRI
jgi:hypothetical protein